MNTQPSGDSLHVAEAEGKESCRSVRTDLRALLGEQLWLAIVKDGMTQGDFAEALGVSQKHVSEAVNGISGKPEFFDRAARLLGREWKVRLV